MKFSFSILIIGVRVYILASEMSAFGIIPYILIIFDVVSIADAGQESTYVDVNEEYVRNTFSELLIAHSHSEKIG